MNDQQMKAFLTGLAIAGGILMVIVGIITGDQCTSRRRQNRQAARIRLPLVPGGSHQTPAP